MCFRDTPMERKFALKSIPSAIALNPTEFIIGIDEPSSSDLENYIRNICKSTHLKNVRLIRVPVSSDWNFQLAHTIWECYRACTYDKVLAFDVDTEIRKTVMLGYDIIGTDNIAVVSFTKRLLTKTVRDRARYAAYRMRVRAASYVFAGIYWVYKPFYFANVKKTELQKIRNGIDTYMAQAIMDKKTHRIVTRKEIGVSCMDYENEDYPWRQFADGIWFFANKEIMANWETNTRQGDTGLVRRSIIHPLKRRHPFLFIVLRSIIYHYPLYISGWQWASKHQESEAVTAARRITYFEWGAYESSKHIKKIKQFDGGQTGLA